MDYKSRWLRNDLEEQLEYPWDWMDDHRHLDGWEINANRILSKKDLLELASELGAISIPHRHRRFGKLG